MYSTREESSVDLPRSTRSTAPPTVQQIAMGLHTSRTPHFVGQHRQRSASARASSSSLPPPPARSAMKRTPRSQESVNTDSSMTSLTTTTASSSKSGRGFFERLVFRKKIKSPATGTKGLPTRSSITTSSESSLVIVDRKAVRFSLDSDLGH